MDPLAVTHSVLVEGQLVELGGGEGEGPGAVMLGSALGGGVALGHLVLELQVNL